MRAYRPPACVSQKIGPESSAGGKTVVYIPADGRGQRRSLRRGVPVARHRRLPHAASDERTRELGGKHTNGDECYPAKVTIGDFLRIIEQPGFDAASHRLLHAHGRRPLPLRAVCPVSAKFLHELGYDDVQILSPSSRTGYAAWATVAGPLHARRLAGAGRRRHAAEGAASRAPLRTHAGTPTRSTTSRSERPLRRRSETSCANAGCQLDAHRRLHEAQARERFRRVPAHYDRERPLIGVVGEIFCRLNTFSNDDLIRKLEGYGAEAWLSDIAEWVSYTN